MPYLTATEYQQLLELEALIYSKTQALVDMLSKTSKSGSTTQEWQRMLAESVSDERTMRRTKSCANFHVCDSSPILLVFGIQTLIPNRYSKIISGILEQHQEIQTDG